MLQGKPTNGESTARIAHHEQWVPHLDISLLRTNQERHKSQKPNKGQRIFFVFLLYVVLF